MPSGYVKWFSDEKSYGFITPDEGAEDIFVHYSDIKGRGFRKLEKDQRVTYVIGKSDKGPKAENVELSLI